MTTETFGTDTGVDHAGTEDSAFYVSFPNDVEDTAPSGIEGDCLLRFTGLSAIPSGATVTDAVLEVVPSSGAEDPGNFTVRTVLRAWVESQTTWNDYATSTAWTTAGAGSDGNDRGATDLCTLSYPGGYSTDRMTSTSNTNLIAFVQAIVDGTTNNGIRVGSPFTFLNIILPAGDDGSRPLLTVTYTAGGTTTPTASGLQNISEGFCASAAAGGIPQGLHTIEQGIGA